MGARYAVTAASKCVWGLAPRGTRRDPLKYALVKETYAYMNQPVPRINHEKLGLPNDNDSEEDYYNGVGQNTATVLYRIWARHLHIQIQREEFVELAAAPDKQSSNDNLVCGNCGFQSKDLDSHAYHVELCIIPA